MAFKNRNVDDMGLDRVAIKLSDAGFAAKYQHYSIIPKKTSPRLRMKHPYSCNLQAAYPQYMSNQET
jgi:hypothetical protein